MKEFLKKNWIGILVILAGAASFYGFAHNYKVRADVDVSQAAHDTVQVQPNWTALSGAGMILNKPSIPAAQVNSDWNASSGISQIINKPSIQQQYHNGVLQSATKRMTFTGTTTSGQVAFYMTTNGLVGGTAVCSNAPSNITVAMNDSGNTFGTATAVTNSNKTLTITVNARSFSSGNALLNLLGGLVNVLTGTTLTAAPNGTPILASVECT